MLKDKMAGGVYAPAYYRDFCCTADKCRHSCCVDWEIYIDEETYAKYQRTKDILATVKECGDGPCFALREDGRCPHLNGDGLCRIILTHGEAYLSEICRNHPRFFNRYGNRTEAGLGIVCEEACRLILEDDRPFSLVRIGEDDGEDDGACPFDALPIRDRIMSVIAAAGDFDEILSALTAQFHLPAIRASDAWLTRFLALEILDAEWEKDLRSTGDRFLKTTPELTGPWGKHYRRLLIYFVYRHVSVASSETDLCARLAFCVLSVQVIRSLFEADADRSLPKLIDLARRYSAEIEYSEDNTDELIFAFACSPQTE